MSTNNGWVRLHRKIEKNPLWTLEPFTKGQAWVDLFMIANHIDGTINVRGNIIPIKRGQLGWAEESLADRWKWSRGKVRRYLKYLETVQQITQQKSVVISIITVLKYEPYQSNNTADDTSDGTTDGHQTVQQTDTNKNVKNVKNNKNISSEQARTPINELLKPFYDYNPTFNFGNTTQRKALEDILSKIGEEKTKEAVQYALSIQGKKYAPLITTPVQLKNKLGDLRAYYDRSKNSRIIKI